MGWEGLIAGRLPAGRRRLERRCPTGPARGERRPAWPTGADGRTPDVLARRSRSAVGGGGLPGGRVASPPLVLGFVGMASVSLSKGGNVSLSKAAPNLTAVTVGLGWQVRQTSGAAYDLDASAIVVDDRGRVLYDKYFVFFNNLTSPDGSVEYLGDNLVGGGGGDD